MQLFYPSCGSKKTVPGSSAASGSEVIESLDPGQIFFRGFSVSFDKILSLKRDWSPAKLSACDA